MNKLSRWCRKFVKEDIQGRLRLLRKRTTVPRTKNIKEYFNKRRVRNRIDGPCAVCGGKASCKHHITPLISGGTNRKDNLINICGCCHSEVHLFMIPKQPEYITDMDNAFRDTLR